MTGVERYLRDLVALCDDAPLIADLTDADIGTRRATASIARAALRWYLDGLEEELHVRLEEELHVADLLAVWRLRRMSGDLSEAIDWAAESCRLSWAELQRRRYGTEAVA
jgi:hypothetical protein